MKKIIWRTPFAIFGAFGLLSLSTGGGVMQVDSNVEAWITIWEAITLPVWRFLLWPLENFTKISLPDWMLNYGTVGLVIYGMSLRFFFFFSDPDSRIRVAGTSESWGIGRYTVLFLFCLSCWPAWMLYVLAVNLMYLFGISEVFREKSDPNYILFGKGLKVFWEAAIWFMLLVAINYALLFKDGELRWQAIDTRGQATPRNAPYDPYTDS